MGSTAFEAQRNSAGPVAAWLVDIYFPAFDDLPALDLFLATTTGVQFYNRLTSATETYEPLLTENPPSGRDQRDRGNDIASFQILNSKNEFYNRLLPEADPSYLDILERARVVVWRIYDVDHNLFEGEVVFDGYIKELTLAESDKTLNVTAISDMSRSGFFVGNRILTRERCGTEFNANGTLSADESICGWQTAQGGNATLCTKYLKGVDGCEAHNNAHRFFAVTALATAPVTVVDPNEIDFPYNTGNCFGQNTFVVVDRKWNTMRIDQLWAGDPILAFNGFSLELEDAKIEEVLIHHNVRNAVEAIFSKGKLEVTPEHPFCIEKGRFGLLGALKDTPVIGWNANEAQGTDNLQNVRQIDEPIVTWNFRTSAHTYIVTDEQKKFFYFVHNKDNTPIEL